MSSSLGTTLHRQVEEQSSRTASGSESAESISTGEPNAKLDSPLLNASNPPTASLPSVPNPVDNLRPDIFRTFHQSPDELDTSEHTQPSILKIVQRRGTWLDKDSAELKNNGLPPPPSPPPPTPRPYLQESVPEKSQGIESLDAINDKRTEVEEPSDSTATESKEINKGPPIKTSQPQTATQSVSFPNATPIKLPPFDRKLGSYIEIHSPAVQQALRCVLDYYPGVDCQKRTTVLHWPYPALVHHDKALDEYKNAFEHAKCAESKCPGQHTYRHIQALQNFYHESTDESIKDELARNERGFATFGMLWLLYQPGDEVLWADSEIEDYQPYIVSEVEWTLRGTTIVMYTLKVWKLTSDSLTIGPTTISRQIQPFAGEKPIMSLQPRPFKLWKSEKAGQSAKEIRKRLVERGRMWFNLRKKGCWDFNGIMSQNPPRPYEGAVMVDLAEYRAEFPDAMPILPDTFENNDSEATESSLFCQNCRKIIESQTRPFKFAGYSKIDIDATKELTEQQYFLCERMVPAFLFKLRTWRILHVDGFRPAQYDTKMLDTLILQPHIKTMIKSLTAKYVQNVKAEEARQKIIVTPNSPPIQDSATQGPWSADFVKGKGQGLIFLLHGKPGVGKTYTAECIAANAQRPLLALTCADIGTNPGTIEQTLVKWFKLAAWWGAIVLLDEADIYMEHRKVQDIERNSLVAGFLRAMDYYNGILFLTTNRVGTFDEAFISRINMPIYYPPFTSKTRREVWETFFSKLEKEKEDTMRIHNSTRDFVQESEELEQLQWNGRDIRNAFQIAVALAETDDEKDAKGRIIIKKDHIRATVEMSKAFKHYLKKVHKKDEDAMAAARGNRYDTPEPDRTRETLFR